MAVERGGKEETYIILLWKYFVQEIEVETGLIVIYDFDFFNRREILNFVYQLLFTLFKNPYRTLWRAEINISMQKC